MIFKGKVIAAGPVMSFKVVPDFIRKTDGLETEPKADVNVLNGLAREPSWVAEREVGSI